MNILKDSSPGSLAVAAMRPLTAAEAPHMEAHAFLANPARGEGAEASRAGCPDPLRSQNPELSMIGQQGRLYGGKAATVFVAHEQSQRQRCRRGAPASAVAAVFPTRALAASAAVVPTAAPPGSSGGGGSAITAAGVSTATSFSSSSSSANAAASSRQPASLEHFHSCQEQRPSGPIHSAFFRGMGGKPTKPNV